VEVLQGDTSGQGIAQRAGLFVRDGQRDSTAPCGPKVRASGCQTPYSSSAMPIDRLAPTASLMISAVCWMNVSVACAFASGP
jgi:hypothetical protein